MADRAALERIAKVRKLLDAVSVASVAVPSPVGDILGAGVDVAGMAVDPASRTPGNMAMAAAGLLPGIPSPSAAKAVARNLGPTSEAGRAVASTLNFDDHMRLAETLRKHRAPEGPPRLDHLFDAKDGLGAVPNNQDVAYFGSEQLIPISEYLRLAEPLKRPSKTSLEHIRKTVEEGGKLGQPSLYVDLVDGVPKVINHDGRHRAMVLQEKYGPDALIPVHVIGSGKGREIAKTGKVTSFAPQRDSDEEFRAALERAEAFLQQHKDKSRTK